MKRIGLLLRKGMQVVPNEKEWATDIDKIKSSAKRMTKKRHRQRSTKRAGKPRRRGGWESPIYPLSKNPDSEPF